MMNRQIVRGVGLAAVAATLVVFVSCGGDSSPASPSVAPQAAKPETGGGSVGSKANTPPTVAARVTPTPVDGTVFGLIPLDVAINLCQSSDADPGDSIRFDVIWGDGAVTGPGAPGAGTTVGEGGGPTGCDGKDCCRHRHRFENAGTYQVEARVSDKHLEDQAGGVSAKAITPYRFTVRAGTVEPSPAASPTPGAAVTTTFESTNVPVSILDVATVQSTVTASAVATIQKVTVSFHLTHTFDNDLDISLIGPDGTTIDLTSDNGGAANDFGTGCGSRTTFDDSAGSSITAGVAPFVGTFQPEGALSAFNGKSGAGANGTWTLRITDDLGGDVGTLLCWAVTITSQ